MPRLRRAPQQWRGHALQAADYSTHVEDSKVVQLGAPPGRVRVGTLFCRAAARHAHMEDDEVVLLVPPKTGLPYPTGQQPASRTWKMTKSYCWVPPGPSSVCRGLLWLHESARCLVHVWPPGA